MKLSMRAQTRMRVEETFETIARTLGVTVDELVDSVDPRELQARRDPHNRPTVRP